MGLFNFGKKDKVIDLSERYKKQQEKTEEIKESLKDSNSQETSSNPFGFFGNFSANSETSQNSNSEINPDSNSYSSHPDDKRKKLAKRLMDMTEKLEEISNQIYHLQQRIEVLEKKTGTGNFN